MDTLTRQHLAQTIHQNFFSARSDADTSPLPLDRISPRVQHVLQSENISTYADLARFSAKQIESLPRSGKATVVELGDLLREKGLDFAEHRFARQSGHDAHAAPTVQAVSGLQFDFASAREAAAFQQRALDAYKAYVGPGAWKDDYRHAVRLQTPREGSTRYDVFVDDAALSALAAAKPGPAPSISH